MANTPKPPAVKAVFPRPSAKPRPRDDETQSFEVERRVIKEVSVGTGSFEEAEETHRIPVEELDEGRPTMEIPKPTGAKHENASLDLVTKRFAKGELIVDFFASVTEALLIKRGRVSFEALNSLGSEPLKNFRPELGPGRILFSQVLTQEADRGIASDLRVTALEETEAYVLSMYDLVGDDLDPIKRRLRFYKVLDAVSDENTHGRRSLVLAQENEDAVLYALDEARARARELEIENGQLRQQVATLDEHNRQLTKSAVSQAVRSELSRLMREVRELRESLRSTTRRAIDAESSYQSQRNYVESLTEEVVEFERLRDLLDLERTDQRKFYSEVQRIFLSLYHIDDARLKQLGVEGLGILPLLTAGETQKALGVDISPLSDEEIEGGISEIASDERSDPTKHPPRGG